MKVTGIFLCLWNRWHGRYCAPFAQFNHFHIPDLFVDELEPEQGLHMMKTLITGCPGIDIQQVK